MPASRFLARCILVAGCLACSTSVAQDFVEINPPPAGDEEAMIALTEARLVDGMGGEPIENAVVVIRGSKIMAAGDADTVDVPEAAERISLAGKTILPGFVDCHFHSMNDLHQPRTFLRNGVTALRDPGHPFRFYQAVMQAEEPMPRVYLCGGHIDAYPPIWPDQAMIANSPERAAQIVSENYADGATAIKLYFRLPLEYFSAVCQRADQYGIPVTAHLELVKASDAISAGVDGIEHVTSFGTSLANDDRVQEFVDTVARDPKTREHMRYRLWSQIDLDNNSRLDSLLKQIVDQQVVVSPTLAVFERRATMPNAEEFEVLGYSKMLDFAGRCHRAGAMVVAGSHTWVPGAKFGFAFQRELELLVECGMTPLQAITAGTLNGAKFLKADARLGSITPGKLADLVVTDGKPDQDIEAARNVDRVMLGGRWIDR
jgi:imidazolonepropionase-like amidohydrolase